MDRGRSASFSRARIAARTVKLVAVNRKSSLLRKLQRNEVVRCHRYAKDDQKLSVKIVIGAANQVQYM